MVFTLTLISSPPVPVPVFWWLYRARQVQVASLSLLCSIIYFSSQARSMYLSLFSLSFNFTLWSAWTAKVLFFCCWQSQGRFYLNFPENFVVLFSCTDPMLCIYYLIIWSNLYFLHNSQGITLITQSGEGVLFETFMKWLLRFSSRKICKICAK